MRRSIRRNSTLSNDRHYNPLHDDKSFGVDAYAETVGPQGLFFILKGNAFNNNNILIKIIITIGEKGQTPIWRKAMWMVIIVGGVIYSAYNIGKFTDRKRIEHF